METSKDLADKASNKFESIRSSANQAVDDAADQADGLLARGKSAVSDATKKVRDAASDTQDSIVTYTQDNPVKALLIAAAAGAVLVSLMRALTPARD